MANNKQTLEADDIPQGILTNISEAYTLAVRIKKLQRIDTPLKLIIELKERPIARLMLGKDILAESEISSSDLDAILQKEKAKGSDRLFGRFVSWFSGSGISISVLASNLAQKWQTIEWPKPRAKPITYLIAASFFVLAGIPSYYVFRDRWQDSIIISDRARSIWDSWSFSSQLDLPAYFSIILISLLALLVLAALVRSPGRSFYEKLFRPTKNFAKKNILDKNQFPPQQRKIGLFLLGLFITLSVIIASRAIFFDAALGFNWVFACLGIFLGILLTTIPLSDIRRKINSHGGKWAAMLLWHFSLLSVLASYFSSWGSLWLSVPFFFLSLANLLRYRARISPIFWVFSTAIVLYSININAWWFAVIGDEYTFFRDSVFIARENSLQIINEFLFRGNFIYGAHPFFSSLLHAVFLKAFGATNFAWRFSSLYYSAIAIVFLFAFFKSFIKRRYALLASFFIGTSHVVMSFGKVGYNNLQALLAFSIVLWASAWAIRSRRVMAFFVLGLAQALCFYVYPGALYAFPLPYLLLLLYYPPRSMQAIRDWATSLFALLLLTFPLFLQQDYWASKVAGTIAFNPELAESASQTIRHFTTNFVYSLISPLYIAKESHFVAVGYTDILLAVFVFIGLALVLTRFWKNRFLTFWILSFGYLLFLVGMTHDREYPPNTRMFLLLPYLAFFAIFAIAWIAEHMKKYKFTRGFIAKSTVLLATIVLMFNLYQAYPLSYKRMTQYHNFEVLFLNIAQRYLPQNEGQEIVFFHDPNVLHLPSLTELLDIYEIPYQPENITGVEQVPISDPAASASIANSDSLVIVDLRLPEDFRTAISDYLRTNTDKLDCPVRHVRGDLRFNLWHSPENAGVCPIP